MRKEPLLTAVPPAPVQSLSELYAIAFDQAQRATHRYGAIAAQTDERLSPVRSVFEALATREQNRSGSLSAACLAACGKRPDASDLRWAPIDLVPAAEIADIKNSSLSTPYTAWVLAARHRQRAFVFWTYVIALAEDPLVRLTAEALAHEALSDGNLLRRERRLAWRAERKIAADETAAADGTDEPASAALLESLLLKDIIAWSQGLDPGPTRPRHDPGPIPPAAAFPDAADEGGADHGVRGDRTDQAPRAAPRRTTVEHLFRRGGKRYRPKQHGARAKTCRSIHHAARCSA